ncbi:MAG: hypothetical protein ACREJO_02310 [Phycisphaerales bacterium]
MQRLFRKLSPIGLVVGPESACAVQLVRSGQRWRLHAAASLARSQPGAGLTADEAERLVSVLDRRGFVFGHVVSAAPVGSCESAVLELPSRASGAPVEQIARGEMARTMRCDATAIEVGAWELPSGGKPGNGAGGPAGTMVVACRSVEAEALVLAMADAGADVVAIDAPCLALARSCADWLTPGAVSAVLELGPDSARTVVTYGHAVIYERMLPEGSMAALRKALADQLKIEPEVARYLLAHHGLDGPAPEDATVGRRLDEARRTMSDRLGALVEEVRTSIAYSGARYPGTGNGRLLLVGEGAQTPGLEKLLGEGTGIETRVVRPVDMADIPDALNEAGRDASLMGALGLALWREEEGA